MNAITNSLPLDRTFAVTAPQTMKAIVQSRYGEAEVLSFGEIARPAIAENEVLVRTRAAGLDRGTWHLMAGKPYLMRLMFGFKGPKNPVLGRDIAGTVVEVGAKVTRFKVGDDVFGTSSGSFAEYASANETRLAMKPANLTFEQAAVCGVSGMTALHAVREAGRVRPGQRVLVVGASGGVGTFAVQIAKALGAEVTGVCSTGKVERVRALGADRVIDYTRADFADGSRQYDVVLDIGGNTPLKRVRLAMTPTATLVFVGGENGGDWSAGFGRQLHAMLLAPFVKQRFAMFVTKEHHSGLEALAGFIEAGQVTPVIDRAWPLSDAPEAMRQLVAGRVSGKLAITVA